MPELMETLETIRAEDASIQRLFGGEDGRPVGRARRRSEDPTYMGKLAEAAKFLSDVVTGVRPAYHLREAMTTSDFPGLFGDIIDRQMLANYQATPNSWPAYVHRSTVADFRQVKRFRVDGGEDILDSVAEQGEYPLASLTDDKYTYSVTKYGRRFNFSWETIINDDLNALRDIPARMGRGASRLEENFATKLFATSSGPDSTLYSAGNSNIVTSNPALSIEGLQTAYTVLGNTLDSDSQPIAIEGVVLVVPPALEITAMNILNSMEVWLSTAGGTSTSQMHVVNWMRNRVKLAVNYQLPLVDTTHGATAWYLFADPNNGRPALEMGFLRGHETPELFMKSSNATRIGGGASDPMDGSFENDSIEYKVRHTLGGTTIDPKMTVASNGSGS